MSRVEVLVNPRIEVRVDSSLRFGGMSFSGHRDQDAETISQHRMLMDRIKKHIEDESGQAPEVVWRYEREYRCSDCGYEWETDPESGEPVCCDKAQAEWRAASWPPTAPTRPQPSQRASTQPSSSRAGSPTSQASIGGSHE